MRRLRWFDFAALILLLLWVMDSQVDFATSVQGWDWWRAVWGRILPPLTAFLLYFGLVHWAARNQLSAARRK